MHILQTTFRPRLSAALTTARANDATGAGASFVYPAIALVGHSARPPAVVNYQSISRRDHESRPAPSTAAPGQAAPPEELEKSGLAQFPSVIGGVV